LLGPLVALECSGNGGKIPARAQRLLLSLLSVAQVAYRRVAREAYSKASIPRSAADVFAHKDPALQGDWY
jgi:hypothetical protein